MVATTYMWVLDRKVVATQSIYTVEASNEDQALLMGIRKKDMTNNITIILTFMMLEPLNWSPSVCETDFQLRGHDYQLTSSYNLTKIFTPRGANFFTNVGATRKTVSCCSKKVSVDRSATVVNITHISKRQ